MTVIADQQVTIGFADPACTDSARTGGKGSNLGRLTAAGLAVPPGFVIPTDTYQRFVEGCSADLFATGARLEDTLRVGIARGDYVEAQGREEEWLAERLSRLHQPGERQGPPDERRHPGGWCGAPTAGRCVRLPRRRGPLPSDADIRRCGRSARRHC